MKKTFTLIGFILFFGKSYSQELIEAIRENNIAKVEKLVENKKKLNATGENGIFPLFSASAEGNLEIAKILINKGVNVNQTLINGGTAMHMACQEGYYELVKYL
ncbi:MAG: ankyrin repeat domain-containing protein, partial [Cloacibacterium sp.]